jgi:hypothetical protein
MEGIYQILGVVIIVATVVGVGLRLTFKFDTFEEKLTALSNSVTHLLQTSDTNQVRIDEVKTDVLELRRDVKDAQREPVLTEKPQVPPRKK